jgi:hypothetical protein
MDGSGELDKIEGLESRRGEIIWLDSCFMLSSCISTQRYLARDHGCAYTESNGENECFSEIRQSKTK